MRIFFAVFRKIIIFAHWYSAFCWICSRTLRGCVDWNCNVFDVFGLFYRRTLRGCVDWNGWRQHEQHRKQQSHPTWVRGLKLSCSRIEIRGIGSHPTWVRGLKQIIKCADLDEADGRTLRGCVDWNTKSNAIYKWAYGRTLRGCVDWNSYACTHYGLKESRTLRGCVDWNIETLYKLTLHFCRTLRGCVDWNCPFRS